MRTCTVNKWSRFKNANLIFIGCSYFSCVCTAVQATNSYVVMYSSWYYLNSFKITGKNYYVTTCCICLQYMNIFYNTMLLRRVLKYSIVMNSNDYLYQMIQNYLKTFKIKINNHVFLTNKN